MSAQELREAAALMRSRAEGSLDGPWQWVTDEDSGEQYIVSVHNRDVAQVNEWSSGLHDGAHIASWHPAVALAVADLITAVADEPWCCDECKFAPENDGNLAHPALAVARAYLGGDQ